MLDPRDRGQPTAPSLAPRRTRAHRTTRARHAAGPFIGATALLVVRLAAGPFRLVERERQIALVGARGGAPRARRTGRFDVLGPDLHRPEVESTVRGSKSA
jgi:hypothetical protein